MRREILTIPDVISDVLDDADGRITAAAKRLAERRIAHLWLTGCGDSAFAGHAAALAFQRHTPVTAHPVHALDLARYQIRGLPADSAVIATSYSGKVGRTIEAAIQARRAGHHVIALTNSEDTNLAQAAGDVLPVEVPTLGFSPGTSTYVAMLCTLLRLAAELAQLAGADGDLTGLGRLPGPGRDDPAADSGRRACRRRPAAVRAVDRVPRRRAQRGDRTVRGREADRGRAAARSRDQHRRVGARGILRHLGRRSCGADQPERRQP